MLRRLANGPKLSAALLALLVFGAEAGDDPNPHATGLEEERILVSHALRGDYPVQDDQPGIVPVSLLLRDYSIWTPTQRARVPKPHFDLFRAMIPNTQGICRNADPTARWSRMSHQLFWQTLEDDPVVLLGEVENVEAAWDFVESSARTILHLRVIRILKNGGYYTRPVVPGDLLYIAKRDGSFALDGGRACSDYPFLHSPDPIVSGTQILVAGNFGEHNRHYLQTARTSRFLVQAGQIQPSLGWGEASAITLTEVLARFNAIGN